MVCYMQLMGQTADDHSSILQACLDLPELQERYPNNPDGKIAQLHIMQHGVSFDEDTDVLKNGKAPGFYSKQEIKDKGIEAYFLFQEFSYLENTARVAFVYQSKDKNNILVLSVVNLDFKKADDTWVIIGTKVENRQL